MKSVKKNKTEEISTFSSETEDINRKDALKKIGTYGKYAALTALSTYIMLSPRKAQATSPPEDPGTGFF